MPSTNRDRLIRPVRSAEALQRRGQVGARARASARQRPSSADSSPWESRQTRSRAPTAPSPAPTARASSSAIVGNSLSIRCSRTRGLAAEPQVARRRRPAPAAQTTIRTGRTTEPPCPSQTMLPRASPTTSPTAPHTTCSARNRSTSGAFRRAAAGGATEADPPRTRLERLARSVTTGRREDVEDAGAADLPRGEQPGRPRGVAQVGQQSVVERGAAVARQPAPRPGPARVPRVEPEQPRRPAAGSPQHPLVLGQPADEDHDPVRRDGQRRADEQDQRAGRVA